MFTGSHYYMLLMLVLVGHFDTYFLRLPFAAITPCPITSFIDYLGTYFGAVGGLLWNDLLLSFKLSSEVTLIPELKFWFLLKLEKLILN